MESDRLETDTSAAYIGDCGLNRPAASRVYGIRFRLLARSFPFSLAAQIARDVLFNPQIGSRVARRAAQARTQERFCIDLF